MDIERLKKKAEETFGRFQQTKAAFAKVEQELKDARRHLGALKDQLNIIGGRHDAIVELIEEAKAEPPAPADAKVIQMPAPAPAAEPPAPAK
jgi:chromosome segregation ATPase